MPDGSGQPSQNTAPLVAVVPPSPPASVAPPSAPPPAAPAKPMVAPAPAGPPAVTLRAGSEAALPRTLDKNYEFMDTSKPYVLNGRYEVAKDAEHVTLTVGPGVEIQGGHLFLANKGEVIINGTPEKPAVLIGVTLSQELTDYPMTAKWTLFDKCQLEKKIGWYAYYSSKWACDSCLLYKCTFPNLKGVDYGIKMTHCAFVKMNIPEIVHRQPREGAFDHMKRLRQDWNTITG